MVMFKPNIADVLAEADNAQELREEFLKIRDSLTTSIREAADLTDLSESQLRYAESRGLLSPSRGLTDENGEPLRAGQRRYSADDLLKARLISWLLYRGYSLGSIADFMVRDRYVIQSILDTKTVRLRSVLDSADDSMFRRFFIPRILYFSLLLLFERDGVDDVGLVWPIRAAPDDLATCAPGPIRSADDLGRLGHIFVAWRARGRPLATFVTIGNPFDRDMRLQLRPFSDVLLDSAEPNLAGSGPTHAYLLLGSEAEKELDAATHLLSMRQKSSHPIIGIPRRQANPRVVAGRLMNYVQRISCTPSAVAHRSESSLNDVMYFTSPEMVAPSGDPLLNRLANAMVELGGSRQCHAPSHDAPASASAPPESVQQAEQRWRFSCILMPREPMDSSKRQELVVRAQSAQAPHRVGVTTASPQANGGLSFRAYSSGRITYRPEVITLDPAVSYVAEESPIHSAIAAPAVDGQGLERSQPPAVIYIASDQSESFSDDDFLLIRVMGRLVGEIVQTYNSRAHAPSALTNTLANPEIVDSDLADFLSELSFLTDLRRVFESSKGEASRPQARERDRRALEDAFYNNVRSISVLGLDIDGFSSIQRNRGERVARQLLRDVGNRLQQQFSLGLVNGIPAVRLYRIWSDRFYAIIRDDDIPSTLVRADRLRKEMSSDYLVLLDRDTSNQSGENPPVSVVMRMVGTTLSRAQMHTLLESAGGDGNVCAAQVSQLVENGLKLASAIRGSDRSLWWRWDTRTYDQTSALLATPPTPPAAIAG